MAVQPDSHQIRIGIDGRCLHVDGDLPLNIVNRFALHRHIYDGGVQIRRERQIESQHQMANVGLLAPLVDELQRQGFGHCDGDSLRPPPLDPTMNLQRVRDFEDAGVIDFVNKVPQGLIEVSPGVSPTRIIKQIISAYPDKRFVFLCHSAEEATKLTQQIRSLGMAVTQVIRRQIGEHEHVARIVVTTHYGAEEGALEFQQSDVVIFPNAMHALHQQAEYELSRPGCRFRLFAFLENNRKLAPYDEGRLVRHFGVDRVCVPRHGHQLTAVRIQFFPVHGPALSGAMSLLAVKRHGIFANHLRNRLVAKHARQWLRGDQAAYDESTPAIPDNLLTATAKSVAVVVENVQHVRYLAPKLQSWPTWTGPGERLPNGLTSARFGFGHFAREGASGLIVTVDGLQDAPLHNTDVLFWAAGGPSRPNIPVSRIVRSYGHERPLLVVDVVDLQHPQLQAWNCQRQRDYFARGWFPVAWDRRAARIRIFRAEGF